MTEELLNLLLDIKAEIAEIRFMLEAREAEEPGLDPEDEATPAPRSEAPDDPERTR